MHSKGKTVGTYQWLLGDELPLPSISQALPETPDSESSGANDNIGKVSESSWELGPATLNPSYWKDDVRCQIFPSG
ncbi:hypothetical protein PDIG_08730 [Penicillium digitatum PHI26]|uniref:Uncharacterized protein n=2 Tax=Penicillium digitatum TaxID=36651 RepID=K9GBS4_PEND2|nr:hypothetical protein PDIP_36760 [Penicillium digitatum Pd1]EKV16343.1 hypothetical protein PDIP_36760 [Penicillium digitatum Pd1]EKV18559.1 hypothetical protein PDIG_08730 [Penicillium digitatum PHI26]